MKSKLADLLKLNNSPVAIIFTNEKPEKAIQFRQNRWGCVAASLVAASKGRTAVFDRSTYGCVGGGVGLGFGNRYGDFPIEHLLARGNGTTRSDRGHRTEMVEGERYFESPDIARKFVESLPMRDIEAAYVVFKPLGDVTDQERPVLILFMVNPDQLSALVVLANYPRARKESVIAPFGAGCQSILFGYEEAEKEEPSAVIGFFDITARKLVARDILSFTVPYRMYQEMERNAEQSFLLTSQWLKLSERRGD